MKKWSLAQPVNSKGLSKITVFLYSDYKKVYLSNVRIEEEKIYIDPSNPTSSNILRLAPLPELLDCEVKEGYGVADLELLVDEVDHRVDVVFRVLVVQVGLQVVAQRLVVQHLIHERRRVFDPNVDEVQQTNGKEFCTKKEKNLIGVAADTGNDFAENLANLKAGFCFYMLKNRLKNYILPKQIIFKQYSSY